MFINLKNNLNKFLLAWKHSLELKSELYIYNLLCKVVWNKYLHTDYVNYHSSYNFMLLLATQVLFI